MSEKQNLNNFDSTSIKSTNYNSSDYSTLYNEILELDDIEEQNKTVSSFDSKTQANLWQLKLDNFLAENTLSKQQESFIYSLKSTITSVNIEKAINNDTNIMLTANNLKLQAEGLFGPHEGWYLLTKFENTNQTLGKLYLGQVDTGGGAIRSCNCTEDSCTRITGVSIWGITWEYGTCGGTCYRKTYIFGLWESSNTGRCTYN